MRVLRDAPLQSSGRRGSQGPEQVRGWPTALSCTHGDLLPWIPFPSLLFQADSSPGKQECGFGRWKLGGFWKDDSLQLPGPCRPSPLQLGWEGLELLEFSPLILHTQYASEETEGQRREAPGINPAIWAYVCQVRKTEYLGPSPSSTAGQLDS